MSGRRIGQRQLEHWRRLDAWDRAAGWVVLVLVNLALAIVVEAMVSGR